MSMRFRSTLPAALVCLSLLAGASLPAVADVLVEYNNDADTQPETASFPITDSQAALNLTGAGADVYLENGDATGTGDVIIIKPQNDPILNWNLEIVNGTNLIGGRGGPETWSEIELL